MSDRIYVVAEKLAQIEYLKRGYEISEPSGKSRYDFIAEKDGRFVRVQVKTGTPFNEGTELLGHTPKGYERHEIDVLVMVDLDEPQCYFIPSDHVVGLTNIRLRLEPYRNGVGKALIGEHYLKFIG